MNTSGRKGIIAALLVGFLGAIILRIFVIDGFLVIGDSMAQTIVSGEYVLINKFAYTTRKPTRGDIVIVTTRKDGIRVIKRIVGLPGDRFAIENERVVIRAKRLDSGQILEEEYLNGATTSPTGIKLIVLDPGEYFALGDNRGVSIDSREFGPVDIWDIKGKVFGSINLKTLKFSKF